MLRCFMFIALSFSIAGKTLAESECHRKRDGEIYYKVIEKLPPGSSSGIDPKKELRDRSFFKKSQELIRLSSARKSNRDAYSVKRYGRTNLRYTNFRYISDALPEQEPLPSEEGSFAAQFIEFVNWKDGVCDIKFISGWNLAHRDYVLNQGKDYLSWILSDSSGRIYTYYFKAPDGTDKKLVEAADLLDRAAK